jgi:octaprenyl-diphosphate synthase
LGKPVLSDLAEGRLTLPLIHSLQGNGRPHRERISGLLRRKDISKEERGELGELLSASGSLAYTFAKASEYSERALEMLERFPESGPQRALAALTRFVLTRKR